MEIWWYFFHSTWEWHCNRNPSRVWAFIFPWVAAPLLLRLENRSSLLISAALLLMTLLSLIAFMYIKPDLSFISGALSGQRENPLGVLLFFAYFLVLLTQHLRYKDRLSAAVLLLGAVLVVIYPTMRDLGRF